MFPQESRETALSRDCERSYRVRGKFRPRKRGGPRGQAAETPVEAEPRIGRLMLARFPLEIHAWTIPLLFATGYVIGYFHFRRKHPDLYAEAERRRAAQAGQPKEPQ